MGLQNRGTGDRGVLILPGGMCVSVLFSIHSEDPVTKWSCYKCAHLILDRLSQCISSSVSAGLLTTDLKVANRATD